MTRITALALVIVGLGGIASAAERAPLADAVEKRDTARIRAMMAAGSNVNEAQADGTTALHWAAYHEDAQTVARLLKAGANVNAANRFGVPPLSLACTNGNAAVVRLLLDAGADANATLKGAETMLMSAARSGSLDAVKALLVKGAQVNAAERRGQTALMWAAAEGHTAIVRALLEANADVRVSLDSGFTPLFFAVREGRIETVRALLQAGLDVNETLQRRDKGPTGSVNNASYKPVPNGTSPLLMAVQNGHFELAIALVDAGADPNDHRTGFTPLHMLTWVRRPDAGDSGDPSPIGSGRLTSLDFAREMVKRGASINQRVEKGTGRIPNTSSRIEQEGATPFLLAADRSDIALMKTLLELGADPLIPNSINTTPLMAAAGLGTTEPLEEAGEEVEAVEAVEMLLKLGADVNAVDSNGATAMHGAAYANYTSVVNLLASRGADPQIWKNRDQRGVTPLFAAEGHIGRLPRPHQPTIDAVTKLMLAAGLSLEGQRPAIKDIYEKPAVPVKPQQ